MKNLIILSIFVIAAYSCSSTEINHMNKEIAAANLVNEISILKIPLLGEISARSAEISGMCWYGDKLILLPQYPSDFDSTNGKIFFLNKSVLLNSISNSESTPLEPDYYSINSNDFEDLFRKGSGFESITINENTAFFTIENMSDGKTETILICGEIDSINKIIELKKESIIKDPADLFIHNISSESILYYNDIIIPIFEVFGKNINNNPKVSVFSQKLEFVKKISFPNIEYRITDVTSVDESGKFWAINYFYPGDNKKLNPAQDEIILRHGLGKSHYIYDPIERLIQFQIKENKIVLTEEPPVYLELKTNSGRNWEAIAKLDDIGFIIATDTFPETILAFVPYKND